MTPPDDDRQTDSDRKALNYSDLMMTWETFSDDLLKSEPLLMMTDN